MSSPCLVLPSFITPYEALSPQINGNPTQNYWLGPSDSHYSTLSNINICTCIAASKTEDWEAEEKPASEVAIQMKLEFVRQDGKVSKLDICEVSTLALQYHETWTFVGFKFRLILKLYLDMPNKFLYRKKSYHVHAKSFMVPNLPPLSTKKLYRLTKYHQPVINCVDVMICGYLSKVCLLLLFRYWGRDSG